MNKKFKKLILPASLLAALQAHALGLGNLQVNSALDEALKGKISLVIDGDDNLDNIKVSIASSAQYEKIGLDKTYVPSNITVNMAGEGVGQYINISSKGPVSEPIVSLLLVVDWANGHLLREYTLLLDPPLFNSSVSEYSQQVQTQTYTAPTPIENIQQIQKQTYTQETYSAPTNNSSSSKQITVEAGETLWQIASRHSNGYTSPQQMMVAIFNQNSSAFSDNDMNFLRKGAVLTIPDSDQASMISKGQAIAEVKSQTQNWSRLQTQNDTVTSTSGSPSPDYGIELVPPSDSDSENTGNATGLKSENSRIKADLNQTKEELATTLLENDELSGRVAELELLVEDQESALTLKDTNLAQLQQQLEQSNLDEVTEVNDTDDVWNADNDATNSESTDTDEQTTDPIVETVDDSIETVADVVDDTVDVINDGIEIVVQDEPEKVAPQVVQPVQEKDVSFMDKLLSYKTEIISALGLLLLGLLGFLFMRKEGNDDNEDFLNSISDDDDAFIAENQEEKLELSLSETEDKVEDVSDALDEIVEGDLSEPEVVIMDDVDDELEDSSIDDFDSQDVTVLDNEVLDGDDILSEEDGLNDLEFDLDDDIELNEVELPEETGEDLETSMTDEEVEDDLSIDFILDEEDLKITEDNDESLDELDLDADIDEQLDVGLDLDLDLDLDLNVDDEITEINDLDEVVETIDDLDELKFDLGEIEDVTDNDLDLDLDELDLDDSDNIEAEDTQLEIDTDVDDNDEADDLTLDLINEVEETDGSPIDIGLDFDDIVDDAIDTKLDLAKAYFEMGDVDGANQMVSEIMEEGSDEQKSLAQELKKEIDG